MAIYKIFIKPSAVKELKRIPKKDIKRITEKIISLAADPRPYGCEKLSGKEDKYRIRQDNYRTLYTIENEKLLIYVIKNGHRRAVNK